MKNRNTSLSFFQGMSLLASVSAFGLLAVTLPAAHAQGATALPRNATEYNQQVGITPAQNAKLAAIHQKYDPQLKAISEKYRPMYEPIQKHVQADMDPINKRYEAELDPIRKRYEAEKAALDKRYKPQFDAVQTKYQPMMAAAQAKYNPQAEAIKKKMDVETRPILAQEKKAVDAVFTPAQLEKIKKLNAALQAQAPQRR